MGVSIHYRGQMDDAAKVGELIEELIEICETMAFKYQVIEDAILNDKGKNPVYKGISITPHPRSESLSLFFDEQGRLMSLLEVFFGDAASEDSYVFVKTQFAGIDTHIWIIALLKYIKKRYISNLKVIDEGEYWEKGDKDLLAKKMNLIANAISFLTGELGKIDYETTGKSADDIADYIEKIIRDKWHNKNDGSEEE